MRGFLKLLILLWASAWVWSWLQLFVTPPTGDGFTYGLNRITALFGWQLAATSLAIPIWLLGVPRATTRTRKWLARMPILLGLLPLLIIAIVVAHAFYTNWTAPPQIVLPA